MKPRYNRVRKKWGLRAAARPRKGTPLAGTVLVSDEEGMGYAYITFDDSFVEAVGAALPMGIGPEHPAYLCALRGVPVRGAWSVSVVPFEQGNGVSLLQFDHTPEWLGTIYRGG